MTCDADLAGFGGLHSGSPADSQGRMEAFIRKIYFKFMGPRAPGRTGPMTALGETAARRNGRDFPEQNLLNIVILDRLPIPPLAFGPKDASMTDALLEIPVKTIRDEDASLADYKGKVLLVVNVASKCGLTPQYEGLESLYQAYRDRGFVVLGFPANDFGAQEPGSNAEIESFCTTSYGVDFPMFGKVTVVGPDKHPLYAALTSAAPTASGDPEAFRARLKGYGMTPNPEPEVLWNFEKFLVGKDGAVIARFAPTTAPDDPLLVSAIETALAAG
jgi:glutathione peroxidase